jgi:hypothetical protein
LGFRVYPGCHQPKILSRGCLQRRQWGISNVRSTQHRMLWAEPPATTPTSCSCSHPPLLSSQTPAMQAKRGRKMLARPLRLLLVCGPGSLDTLLLLTTTCPPWVDPASLPASLQTGQLLQYWSCNQDFLDHSRQDPGSHLPPVWQSSWRTTLASRSEHLCPDIPL